MYNNNTPIEEIAKIFDISTDQVESILSDIKGLDSL